MEGFEPPVELPLHRISSAARSTTPAHLRGKDKGFLIIPKQSFNILKMFFSFPKPYYFAGPYS